MRADLIQALDKVTTHHDMARHFDGICAGAEMEHYLVVGMSAQAGNTVNFVYQNGIPELREALQTLGHWSIGRMLEAMKRTTAPVVFGQGAEPGIELQGYRSGVAMVQRGPRDSHLVFFGCDAPALPPDLIYPTIQAVVLTAAYSMDSLYRIHASTCPFSERELQCLTLSAQGLTAKVIGQRLGLSHRTVEHCLESSRKRCGAATTAAAALYAFNNGWLGGQDSRTAAAG